MAFQQSYAIETIDLNALNEVFAEQSITIINDDECVIENDTELPHFVIYPEKYRLISFTKKDTPPTDIQEIDLFNHLFQNLFPTFSPIDNTEYLPTNDLDKRASLLHKIQILRE